MRRWARATALPVAAAIPFLGLLGDVIDTGVAAGGVGIGFFLENPNFFVWFLWTPMILLMLRLEERFPLARPTVRAVVVHLVAVLAIVGTHIGLVLLIARDELPLIAQRTPIADWLLLRVFPRFFVIDLLIYGLAIAAAYALRAHLALRERERDDARLHAELLRAEVDALKMHLDPDLVLGALQRIADDIATDPRRAERRIEVLSDFLELLLAEIGSTSVPLHRELALTSAYVALEAAMRDDGEHVDLRVPQRELERNVASFSILSRVRERLKRGDRSIAVDDVPSADLRPSIRSEAVTEIEGVRRILGLTRREWLVVAVAPLVIAALASVVPVVAVALRGEFNAGRLFRTFLHALCMTAMMPFIVAAAAPRVASRIGRALHLAAMLALAVVLSFATEWLFIFIDTRIRERELWPALMEYLRGSTSANTRWLFFGATAFITSAQYARRTRQAEVEGSLMRARLAGAQLRALKMQLHPHFLFNTLNAIAGLLDDDLPAARLMTQRLESFLRISLTLGDAQEVPLRDELRFVMTYLEIQRARFGDRLRVTLEADESVLDALVPPLILQPLVENAIRHGIAPKKSGGSVRVIAAARDEQLALTIEDDGAGMPSESLSPGIGLSNTRARLQQHYGARQRVTFRSMSGSGFAIELLLPRRSSTE